MSTQNNNEILETIDLINRKYKLIKSNLESSFYERELLIELTLLAIFSQNNLFIYGKPGTAKTSFINTIGLHFPSLKFFCDQGGHDSTKDDFFGPLNVELYTSGKSYERLVEGFALESDVLFIDEFSDLPEKVQRSLLGISSKIRTFKNGSKLVKWQGRTCLFASNFYRHNDQTEAVNDRILLKCTVDYLGASLIDYLLNYDSKYSIKEEASFSKEELDKFDELKESVKINRTGILLAHYIYNNYNKVLADNQKTSLTKENDNIFSKIKRLSDRAMKEYLDIVKTYAILNNGIILYDGVPYVENTFLINALRYIAPIIGNSFSNKIIEICNDTAKNVLNKICSVTIYKHDAKQGKYVEEKFDLNVAVQYILQVFQSMVEKIINDKNRLDYLSEGWNITNNSSAIIYLKETLSKIDQTINKTNKDIFKDFPILSSDQLVNIKKLIDSIDVIYEHIKVIGSFNKVTYGEILSILENQNLVKNNKIKII